MGADAEFVPFLPRKAAIALLADATVGCVPSAFDDPSPLALGELLAAGLAVVARRRGGIEATARGGAWLYDTQVDLRDALERLLTDPGSRRRWAIRATQAAERGAWRYVHDSFLASVEARRSVRDIQR